MKNQFQIKPFKCGYGIFLKSIPDKPLQVFSNIHSAKIRLNQYLNNVKKGALKNENDYTYQRER